MEQRIVLSAVAVAPRAAITSTVAPKVAVNATVIEQKILSTVTTTVNKLVSLEVQLQSLAAQMGQLPAGSARQPMYKQATKLVNAFSKQESAQYKKALTLARRAPTSGGVATAAAIEQATHQQVLTDLKRQIALFGWASYTTFTVVLPQVQGVAVPNVSNAQSQSIDTVTNGGQVKAKDQTTPITQEVADSVLLVLESFLARAQSMIPTTIPYVPCDAKTVDEEMGELADLSAAFVLVALKLKGAASTDAWESFVNQAVQTIQAIGAARHQAQMVVNSAATVTFIPPHHPGISASPPTPLPSPPNLLA
jgi:hypothetical protein